MKSKEELIERLKEILDACKTLEEFYDALENNKELQEIKKQLNLKR